MGMLDMAAGTASTLASVGKGVASIVKGTAGLAGKVGKSLIGKFVLGAGAVALLAGKPGGDSPLAGIADKFKSFLGTAKEAVLSKIQSAALTGAAMATRTGTGVEAAIEAASAGKASGGASLAGAVADGSAPEAEAPEALPAEPAAAIAGTEAQAGTPEQAGPEII